MRRTLQALCLVLALALSSVAQNPQPITASRLNLPVSITLAPVTSASISVIGNPGPQTYYYWFVPNYSLGQGPVSGPFVVSNAPNVLSGANYVQAVPSYPPGASLDMLRTKTPAPPVGNCNCAVATGQTSGAFTDLSNSLSSYTIAPALPQNLGLSVANEVVGSGATDLILRQNGAFVADLSISGGGNITGPGSSTTGDIAIWNNLTGSALADSFVAFPLANSSLQHASLTANGQTCILGSTCTLTAVPSGSATGDLGGSFPAPTVQGVNGVPLCTGFTPTNGQALVYVTTSSPNPCYAAVANTSTVNAAQFSLAYYSGAGSSPTINGVTGAASPNGVPQVLASVPAAGVATTPVLSLPGIAGRSVTGASDTIVSTDCNPKRIAYTGSAAVAVTLPTATTLGVPNCSFKIANNTTNTVTVTPTTWTISAGSGGTAGASLVIQQGQEAVLFVDPKTASNWAADVTEQGIIAGTNVTLTRSASGLTIAAAGGAPSGAAGGDLSGTYPNPSVVNINGTAFAGTSGDLVKFGAANIPVDTLILASNVALLNVANTFTSAGRIDLTSSPATNGLIIPSPGGSCGAVVAGGFCFNGNNYIGTNGGGSPVAFVTEVALTNNTVPKWASSSFTNLTNSSIIDAGSGVTIGSPTGGAQGSGTINAAGLYVAGNLVTAFTSPTQLGCPYGGTTAGTSAAQTLTVPNIPATATAGTCISFTAGFAGTSSTTLAVTPTGGTVWTAANLEKRATTGIVTLSAVDEVAAGVYQAMYDGTEWVILTTSGTTYTAGALTANGVLSGNSNNQIQGTSNFLFTAASGLITKLNGETLAGVGTTYVRGVTSQKAESAADASVLSVTPAAVVGTYCATFNLSVSAASAATLGWTMTYTDSSGNAQTPTNLAFYQAGTAAPALTFTTSAAGDYYGTNCFDVNSAATAIVVKLTFAGTSFTGKASAVIERKQ